ncbi:MAG: lipopolysaccharide biosynthesis protein [Aquamicrobium sp.]|uniref:lipopolysaccharide biosynthesis protein n=1 Tax=Mesorhizobium sp. Pch-S TaxID=2082387 RepID=UPI0013EE30E8|nr:lipopolysaccharide biosynthesis protein [Mesorhizobium sp. Pch-S]MBR2687870.1 lipopolysaccharide biosynthesis protein [Aquamicrobium sp.]
MPIRLRLLRERFVVFFGKGSYGRDTLINTLGVLFAAVIPVAVLPILSRLYSPAEFGLFGVFAALVGLGTIASTGRYEAAILLPEEDDAAVSIACAAFLFLTAFVSALAIIFTLAYFIGVGSVRAHSALIGLGVIAVAFSGCVQILLSAAIRKRVFAKVSFARFCAALVSAFLSILLGASTQYAEGLAIGVTAGYAVCALILSRVVARQYGGVSLPDRAAIYGQVKRYRNFPLFSLPSDFSNTLATNLPVLFFSTFFGSAATGYLTMFQRIWAGTSIMVTGLGETFRQRAATERQQTGNFNRTMRVTLLPLVLLSVVLCATLVLLGPKLFEVVAGVEWREAGVYGQILAPFVCLQFVASPVSWSFYIAERLKLLAVWQLALLVSFSLSLFVGSKLFSAQGTLAVLSCVGVVLYAIYILISERISREENKVS